MEHVVNYPNVITGEVVAKNGFEAFCCFEIMFLVLILEK